MKLNFRNLFKKNNQEPVTAEGGAAGGSSGGAVGTANQINPSLEDGDVDGNGKGSDDDEEDSEEGDIFVVNEHERWRNDLGWSSRNLEVGDPKRYVSKLHQSDTAIEAPLPPGWQYVGTWYTPSLLPSCLSLSHGCLIGKLIQQFQAVTLDGSMDSISGH